MDREGPMGMRIEAAPTDYRLSAEALHKLTQWLSPAFPVGAYSYSHGLEWAVETGDVLDAASAQDWIFSLIKHGGGRNDAILLAHGFGAEGVGELAQVAEMAEAFVSGSERLQETLEMGAALARVLNEVWNCDIQKMPFPVILGAVAKAHTIPVAPAVSLYLHSFGANLVSAAQRLVPLGQVEGQRIIANMALLIQETVPQALEANLDDLGGCAFRGDMASMRHETQKVRLFRT